MELDNCKKIPPGARVFVTNKTTEEDPQHEIVIAADYSNIEY